MLTLVLREATGLTELALMFALGQVEGGGHGPTIEKPIRQDASGEGLRIKTKAEACWIIKFSS